MAACPRLYDGLVTVRAERHSGVGYDDGGERLVDLHVGRLRHKIEDESGGPRHLVTVRGLGYNLQR